MTVEASRTLIITTEHETIVAHIPADLDDGAAESIGEKALAGAKSKKAEHYLNACVESFDMRKNIEEQLRQERFRIVATL